MAAGREVKERKESTIGKTKKGFTLKASIDINADKWSTKFLPLSPDKLMVYENEEKYEKLRIVDCLTRTVEHEHFFKKMNGIYRNIEALPNGDILIANEHHEMMRYNYHAKEEQSLGQIVFFSKYQFSQPIRIHNKHMMRLNDSNLDQFDFFNNELKAQPSLKIPLPDGVKVYDYHYVDHFFVITFTKGPLMVFDSSQFVSDSKHAVPVCISRDDAVTEKITPLSNNQFLTTDKNRIRLWKLENEKVEVVNSVCPDTLLSSEKWGQGNSYMNMIAGIPNTADYFMTIDNINRRIGIWHTQTLKLVQLITYENHIRPLFCVNDRQLVWEAGQTLIFTELDNLLNCSQELTEIFINLTSFPSEICNLVNDYVGFHGVFFKTPPTHPSVGAYFNSEAFINPRPNPWALS